MNLFDQGFPLVEHGDARLCVRLWVFVRGVVVRMRERARHISNDVRARARLLSFIHLHKQAPEVAN